MDTEPACIQVVIVPELRLRLEQWLRFNGLVLARIPGDELADDLPTYVVHPLPPAAAVTPPATREER